MKYYAINDLQGCNFMDDTWDEPMTANELRSRFWSLDDARASHYKYFTRAYIEDMWEVEFLEAFNRPLLANVKSADEARELAIDWQTWASEQSLSYGELAHYGDYFRALGKRFHMLREFKTEGIL